MERRRAGASRASALPFRQVAATVLLLLLALLHAPTLLARLLIVEIHYHPAGTPGEAERLEFLEVFNDEPLAFDISDYRLEGGIQFTFPRGTLLAGRSVAVVAADPDLLANTRDIDRPLGPFAGRLDNGGESILLVDTGGSTVSRVGYNDRNRWPAAPDGAGPSLVLRDPLLDPGESESWGWSPRPGGTPGTVSFEVVLPEALINEVQRSAGGTGWVELFNPGSESVDLSHYRLIADAGGTPAYALPAGSRIAPRGFLAVVEAELGVALDAADQPLFLTTPDGDRIVDARHLEEHVEGTSDGRSPDGSDRWYHLTTPSRGAANPPPALAAVVISEIQYHPHSEEDAEEFIEITNIGDVPAALDGFAFTAGIDYLFPDGTTLAPGEYLVVAGDPARIEQVHGIRGVLGPWEGVLANRGEMVRLRDRRGNPVDEVRYFDDGSWPRWADGDGPSLELVDLRQDNSAGDAWRESAHEIDSAWESHEYRGTQKGGDSELHLYLLGAGEILVDDIEVVPAEGGDNLVPDGDFDGPAPLARWLIQGTHIDSRLEEGGGPDGSNALRIVASGRGDSRVNRIERQTAGNLRRGAEYIVRFRARWLRGSDLLMTRSWNHGIARVTRLGVPAGGGTPGRANSRFEENTGPVISRVEQEPVLPVAPEPVTVRARVTDPDGVAGVLLHFRRDGTPQFASVAMRDDGLEPDRLAGDGIYAGRIDESIAARRAVAEFYIEARDGRDTPRLSPPDAPGTTHIYQYDDGIRAHEVPACRAVLLERDFRTLTTRPPFSNHLLPATLVYAKERIFHRAGLRYRGSPFLRRDSVTGRRKGIRVRLADEDPLVTSVRLTLDEQAADGTVQVDRIVRHLLQKAGGIPYGERHHIHMILRGVSFGTYEQVLHVDGSYLRRAFGEENDDGDLYKIDAHYEINDQNDFAFPTFTSWKHTDNREDLRFTYKKRSREKADDFSQLFDLLDLMDTRRTSDEEFDARAADLIDLDLWVKGIAVYRAVEDWDAIGGWTGKNVYLYRQPGGRWKYIPWDHDVALGAAALQPDQNARAYLYTPYFPEIRRLLERPALDRKFNAELLRLMEEDYTPEVFPVVDQTFAFLSRTSGGVENPGGLKNFMRARRSFILSRISDPAAFTIETNDGKPFVTNEASVLLSGKAPYDVERILLADSAPDLRWRDRDTWELTVALAAGENSVQLFAFDGTGELLDTASIRITRAPPSSPFLRGDANGDGSLNITDPVRILAHLFQGGTVACEDAADADDSGSVNITDPIALLGYLFLRGAPPPLPFPEPGPDPTPDDLACP